jgi:hypothetical protein
LFTNTKERAGRVVVEWALSKVSTVINLAVLNAYTVKRRTIRKQE